MLEVTDKDFAKNVIEASKEKMVLVDFWAPWCGPCKALAPHLEELGKELAEKVEIVKVNVDDNAGYSAEFGIRNIPTVLFFRGGKIIDKFVGSKTKGDITKQIEKNIKNHQ
jgi:thioredoxin 1